MKQIEIVRKTGFSQSFISMILSGQKRVRVWDTAKKLADATGTEPEVWLEWSPEKIKNLIEKI